MRVDPSGALELGPADLLPGLREKPPARPAPEHFRLDVRIGAWYAAGAGQRYRVTYDCGHTFEDLTDRFVLDAPWEHRGRSEPELVDEGPDDLTDDELAMMRADAKHGRLEGVTCTYALRAADEIARRRKPR